MMKKLLLTIVFFLIGLILMNKVVNAPTVRCIYMNNTAVAIYPYIRIMHAVNMAEAQTDKVHFDTLAYNPKERAVGAFQIRPARLKDYNRQTGHNYRMEDLFDYNISKEIFLFYAYQIGWRNPQRIARKWNGSGPKTLVYWKKVKKWL